MSSNKRRKLNSFQETKNISAFAARQQAKFANFSQAPGGAEGAVEKVERKKNGTRKVSDELLKGPSFVEAGKTSRLFRLGLGQSSDSAQGDGDGDGGFSDSSPYERETDEVEGGRRKKSRGMETPAEPVLVQLTTVKASKDRLIREDGGHIRVKLAPGERLVALGEYGLSVIRGRITILGATLSSDHTVHHVYALSSHSLPVIRYLESDNEVVIRLSQLSTGLRTLKKLSPLFCRLWNESTTNLAGETDNKERSSFQILFSTACGPKKMYLQHVYSPPEWNETLASVSSGKWNRGTTSSIMICGPKGSGKSTFAKLLINRLLTFNAPKTPRPTATAKRKKPIGVLLLDLDPGQPEYSPPGQLSLLHLAKPNFGPPFAHPDSDSGGCTVIRSHSISAISPSQDSDHYMACVVDLLSHYRHYISSNAECPLIINTPGWVLGTGLELLLDLIKHSKPTVVIYMSIEGPLDVVRALRDEAGKTPVVTLPSQISEYMTRTAAQLRTMQTMSYFHLNQTSQGVPSWKGNPLTSMPPWVVRYAGENSGIVGIMCLGEQPPAAMLKEAINGTVVAVVVIDDMSAIAGSTDDNNGQDDLSGADGSLSQGKRQIIVNTPEDLPYLNPDLATPPDPKHSHSLGVALVRGIDTASKTLHLLTPISAKVLREMSHYGKSMVLVSGKLETPGWAYTEELYRQAAAAQSVRNKALEEHVGDERGGAEEEEEVEVEVKGWEDAPWIERVEGHQGRGVGARVWKVRRDLGRGGDGV